MKWISKHLLPNVLNALLISHLSVHRAEEGWYNHGYIFPEGFQSKVNFRSSVVLDQLCIHECSVLGEEGEFWPQPTFKVVAMDQPELPFYAKSCTGCWSAVSHATISCCVLSAPLSFLCSQWMQHSWYDQIMWNHGRNRSRQTRRCTAVGMNYILTPARALPYIL